MLSCSFSYVGFYCHALALEGFDGVAADTGGDDEGLGIVHLEGGELAFGTFDEGCFAIDEVEDVDAASGVVLNGTAEGVAARLDELVGMQAGAFLLDAVLLMKHLEVVGYLVLDERCGAFPLDDELASLHVNGPWLAVQAESGPVPKLECEDAWGRAYLEHHAIVA